MEADTNSLADRVRQLEQQLEQLLQSGIPVQQAAQAGQNQIALQQEVKSEQDPVEQLNEKFPPAKVEELIELVERCQTQSVTTDEVLFTESNTFGQRRRNCVKSTVPKRNERGKWIFLRGTRAY